MKQFKLFLFFLGLTILFCGSFVWFYNQSQVTLNSPIAEVEKTRDKILPKAKLVDLNSNLLSDDELRKGKVILVFVTPDCDACLKESEFLSGLINKQQKVKFFGVTSYGKPEETLKIAQEKFPFKVYYDAESLLALQLKITRVPIKIYVEDGIIKKVWGGATVSEDKKAEFISWLEKV
ncbi:MAG: TlpA family protein disulfide reductase [Aridibacter sp.]